MDPVLVGVIGLAILFFLLIVVQIPIGVGMSLIGFAGFWYLVSGPAALSKLSVIPFDTLSNYTLATVPLFLLMGNVITYVGFGSTLYEAAARWMGRLPGGLAVATVGGSAIIGAIDPGNMMTLSIMSLMAYPEMEKHGYDHGLAAASIAAGSGLGPLIPPSGPMIMFGVLTGASVGALFIAGIIPGIILALLYVGTILIRCWISPKMGPRGPVYTFKEKVDSLKGSVEILLLTIFVLVGIFVGWFTPTESGAIGAFGAIVLAFVRKRLTWPILKQCFTETFELTGMIYFIMIGALIFSGFMTVTELPFRLSEFVTGLGWSAYAIMGCIIVVYLILGCFMDVMAMITLTVPIFLPLSIALGFNTVWFCIMLIMMVTMAGMTPPVAMTVWILSAMLKKHNLSQGTIYRGLIPFYFSTVFLVILMLFVPQVVTWLPSIMK